MRKVRKAAPTTTKIPVSKTFHLEFLNKDQQLAWTLYQKHDIIFLIGPAGVGKSFLGMAFAVNDILQKHRQRIILTRPIVESGESLGYLPGDLSEKVGAYLVPLYDCLTGLVGFGTPQREQINRSLELAPLAYLRGRTFASSVAVLDEAQNCTYSQLKLYLTRFGKNTKMIVTADPTQSDIGRESGILEVLSKVKNIPGVGIMEFSAKSVVRHPLVAKFIEVL